MNKFEIFLAGHGGQGVLDLGNFLAFNWLLDNHHVVYTPSYGPETRGGKVRCFVIISREEVDSPIILHPDLMIVMNMPSMDFVPLIKKNGYLIYNSSLINKAPERSDLTAIAVPATEIADNLKNKLSQEVLGDIKDTKLLQNAVVYGVILALAKGDRSKVTEVISHFYTGKKGKYIQLNVKAAEAGMKFVDENNFAKWNILNNR